MAEPQPVSGFDLLDNGVVLHVLAFLSPRQVCAAASTCKLFAHLAKQPALWKQYYEQLKLKGMPGMPAPAPSPTSAPILTPAFPTSPVASTDWRQLVLTGLAVQELRVACWSPVDTSRTPTNRQAVRPCAREGHAASSWGPDGQDLILFGGWGSGIRNDLFILERQGDTFQWRAVQPHGPRPVIRYGHSVTRCGAEEDMLLVYGGMQSGGYQGEIEELAVLRPRSKPGVDSTHTAASGSAAGSAAAVGGAVTAAGGQAVTSQNLQRDTGMSTGAGTSRHSLPGRPGVVPQRIARVEYEWVEPNLKGARPQPRGYHAACASPDGRLVYLFGGIADCDCCNTFAVVNVETWECELPTTHGEAPPGRFGCSMAVWGGGLWVVGGGHGSDLARSGYDLHDVWRLDLSTLTWERPQLANQPHDARVMGRCHASCLVGSKLVLFGGSLDLGNSITWLDLDTRTWGQPTVMGTPPMARMSAVMTRSGTDLLVFGGWIYSLGEMGDLHRLRLDLSDEDRDSMRQMALASHGPRRAPADVGANNGAGSAASPAAGGMVGGQQHLAPTFACRRQGQAGRRGAAAGGSSGRGGDGGEPSSRGAGRAGSSSATGAATSAAAAAASAAPDHGVQADAVPTDDQERSGQGRLPRGLLQPAGGEPGPSSSNHHGHAGSSPSGSGNTAALEEQLGHYFSLRRQLQGAREAGRAERGLWHQLRSTMQLMHMLRAQMTGATWFVGISSEEEDEEEQEEEEEEEEEGEEEEEEEAADSEAAATPNHEHQTDDDDVKEEQDGP